MANDQSTDPKPSKYAATLKRKSAEESAAAHARFMESIKAAPCSQPLLAPQTVEQLQRANRAGRTLAAQVTVEREAAAEHRAAYDATATRWSAQRAEATAAAALDLAARTDHILRAAEKGDASGRMSARAAAKVLASRPGSRSRRGRPGR